MEALQYKTSCITTITRLKKILCLDVDTQRLIGKVLPSMMLLHKWRASEGGKGVKRWKAFADYLTRWIVMGKPNTEDPCYLTDKRGKVKVPNKFSWVFWISKKPGGLVFATSVLAFHRLIHCKPDFKISSITDPRSSSPDDYIKAFIACIIDFRFREKVRSSVIMFEAAEASPSFRISASSGPTGARPGWTDFMNELKSLMGSRLKYIYFILLLYLRRMARGVNNDREITFSFLSTVLKVLYGVKWWKKALLDPGEEGDGPLSHTDSEESLIPTSRLTFLSDKSGKTRVVALLDSWSQALLYKYHRRMFHVLRKFFAKTDGTYDQDLQRARVKRWTEASVKFKISSLDLSNATDRLPAVFQAYCMWTMGVFVNPLEPILWLLLMVYRKFYVFAPFVPGRPIPDSWFGPYLKGSRTKNATERILQTEPLKDEIIDLVCSCFGWKVPYDRKPNTPYMKEMFDWACRLDDISYQEAKRQARELLTKIKLEKARKREEREKRRNSRPVPGIPNTSGVPALTRSGEQKRKSIVNRLREMVIFRRVSYAVGQPMGAYSSFGALALTHHWIVLTAAGIAGYRKPLHYRHYAILGDDIVIRDQRVALAYQKLMGLLGVTLSPHKSIVATTGVAEFAKSLYLNGTMVSAIPPQLLQMRSDYFLQDCVILLKHLTERGIKVPLGVYLDAVSNKWNRSDALIAITSPYNPYYYPSSFVDHDVNNCAGYVEFLRSCHRVNTQDVAVAMRIHELIGSSPMPSSTRTPHFLAAERSSKSMTLSVTRPMGRVEHWCGIGFVTWVQVTPHSKYTNRWTRFPGGKAEAFNLRTGRNCSNLKELGDDPFVLLRLYTPTRSYSYTTRIGKSTLDEVRPLDLAIAERAETGRSDDDWGPISLKALRKSYPITEIVKVYRAFGYDDYILSCCVAWEKDTLPQSNVVTVEICSTRR